MTIEGSDLNSVAEPHITLTVIVRRFDNDTNTTSSTTDSNAQVNDYVWAMILDCVCLRKKRANFEAV